MSSFLLAVFVFQIIQPTQLLALTGGPSQPEVQSFQPIGVSDMVDPFSGDFSYNLPLLDIDGYPINMVYNSGISTDAEASWVGLGWNINPGVINRNMRGLPDDFNGDIVTKHLNLRPNKTIGFSGKFGKEIFGYGKEDSVANFGNLNFSFGLGINYNNYNGVGIEQSFNLAFSAGDKSKGKMTAGLGISSSSENGLTISPSLSFEAKASETQGRDKFLGLGVGTSFNNRAGLSELTIDASSSNRAHYKSKSTESSKKLAEDVSSKGGFYDFNAKTSSDVLSGGLGSSISFGMNNYSPTAENPMVNYSTTFSFKPGGTFFGADFTGNFSGYFSMQKLKDKTVSTPAYGYINMQNAALGSSTNNNLLDFNREKDGGFNVNLSNLPLTNYTYDILSINGHGIGGSFRPFRNDIGAIADPLHRNTSTGGSLGGEASSGSLFKVGLDLHVNYTNSQSNIWNEQNPAKDKIKFLTKGPNESENVRKYEPFYFKQTGELSVDNESEFPEKFLKDKPVKISLEKAGRNVFTKSEFTDKDGNTYGMSDEMYRKQRARRGQVMAYLKRDELSRYALTDYSNITYNAPGHHMSEISVVRTDGARYYYGIPAYNITQEQTTFAVGKSHSPLDNYDPIDMRNDESGLIRYNYEDNSKDNKKGINDYYNSEITPPYAHSYLLTAIVSPEYTDIDGVRGPSKGDLGNYTLFEYKKLSKPYKWRVPFDQFKANYNEGLKTDEMDDQANYQYGEKEIWYLEKIVTKNTVAIFTTEPRKDSYGVDNHDGGYGKNSIAMHLLRKISLYSKPDYDALGTSAVPIKEVHFEYDYSLCPGIPNNIGLAEMSGSVDLNEAKGKLTLKKVYFTYGKSYKAKFSPYTFEYADFNPDYNMKAYDRWGNYKSNEGGSFDVSSSTMHTSEFPYVEQDKTLADENSTAWQLSEISLPSGGIIKVTYESDDYAYVQNKKAMQMFRINSIGYSLDPEEQSNADFLSPANNKLMEDYLEFGASNRVNEYLTVKLQEEIPSSMSGADADKYFREKYLKGIDNLYFRVLGHLIDKDNAYEYVSGYAEIILTECGVKSYHPDDPGTNYNYGYIKIKKIGIGDRNNSSDVHPISKAIWQFGRTRCSRLVNDQPPVDDVSDNFVQVFKAIKNSNVFKNLYETFLGPNRVLQNKNFGKDINLSKSVLRLNNPTGYKLGGGCRVKKIEISDEWGAMVDQLPGSTSNPTYSYGQEYNYETTDETTGDNISSGVAAYEPSIGGDENPFKQPVFAGDKEEKLLAPDDKSYMETPFGESFFPSPSVGYSKVTVRNLQYEDVKRHATGYVVNEFYTAKDFPTIVDYTSIDFKPYKTKKVWHLLNKSSVDYMTTSQGYVIELNDMHGKQKATWVYAEDSDKPISGMEYKYNCEKYGDVSFKLKNDATVINKDGTSEQKDIGVEYDVFVDFREENTKTYSGGTDYNTAGFLAAIFPAVIPTVLPEFHVEKTRYRSAVVTKLVYRYAMMKETIAHDLGSSVPTKNLAYDAESGQVLLTMTKNEFEDDIYNFQYPAHWFYEEMGSAYKNLGAEISDIDFDVNGTFAIDEASDIFFPGDEVSSNGEKGWVSAISGNNVTMINFLGLPFKPSQNDQVVKILRSGRRNIISANMGSLTTTINPLNSLADNNINGVLSASAQIFRQGWKTYCECFTDANDIVHVSKNPYVNGQKGIYRPYKAFAFLTDRTHSLINSNTNIRVDGLYTTFTPYWQIQDGNWVSDATNWQWTTEITEYGPYGEELENMDALYRYSSAVFGYNHSLPIAVAANAKRKAIGYDGMEDYDFIKCSNDHFSYKTATNKTIETDAHTGKKSVKVTSSNKSTVTKPVGDDCDN
ncbi:MAG: hypothetical protein V4613_09495 [Bacteroidota bacterium]